MNQIVVDSMMKAYTNGFLTLEDLCSLSEISVEYSSKPVRTMAGKVTYRNSSRTYSMTIYTIGIIRFMKEGKLFNGIKPDDTDHAIRLVIEHEVGHIINDFKGGRGHDKTFRSIMRKCYGHTAYNIR